MVHITKHPAFLFKFEGEISFPPQGGDYRYRPTEITE